MAGETAAGCFIDKLDDNLNTSLHESLDFEDENTTSCCTQLKTAPSLVSKSKLKKTAVTMIHSLTSDLEKSSGDEGELKSDEESGLDGNNSSEEGEVLSEVEELEVAVERSPVKDETPWERGLRLARERMEKAKALKAAEKDIVEKRMNLAVPAPVVDDELERVSKEDVFWPYYYQISIIGRTELTGHRFLPEDLQPPAATELAQWRLGLSDEHRGRRQQKYRRGSARRGSSQSFSSSASSSSRASSRSSSAHSSSDVSSLLSVAASWKTTCAQAMKDYLSSPIRNKDRRGGRYHGHRRSSSASSGSRSHSSDSGSGSDQSQVRVTRRHGYGAGSATAAGKSTGRDGRDLWEGGKQTFRRSRSGSDQSSVSRSSAASSTQRRRYPNRKYDSRKSRKDEDWQESPEHSGSPSEVRRRSDAPPLPHERPVKRPWVAAPALATGMTAGATNKGPRTRSSDRSRSNSHSDSNSSTAADEKRFITSWSKSPSSGDDASASREGVRRDRLPDVVPGSHVNRVRRPATPSRRKKSRSPFLINAAQTAVTAQRNETLANVDEFSVPRQVVQQPATTSVNTLSTQDSALLHAREEPPPESAIVPPPQPTQTAGELPSASNRPGVRMTLAPRLKTSTVDMVNLAGGVTRPGVGRSTQPSPPRMPRLPFPIPTVNRGHSPISSGHALNTAPVVLGQDEIRRQAEAAAAVVEARERRRAAAEAARRRRNPNRKKRDDLSKIPIRGRPTYRRVSFSDSDVSGTSKSGSSSRSGSVSRSRSGTPDQPPSNALDPRHMQMNIDYRVARSHHGSHKRHKTDVPPPMDYDRTGDGVNMMIPNHGRHSARTMPQEYVREDFQTFERKPHRVKVTSYEGMQKHRVERQHRMINVPYQTSGTPHKKTLYSDYGIEDDTAYPPSMMRRESRLGGTNPLRFASTLDIEPGFRFDQSGRRADHRRYAFGIPEHHHQQMVSERPIVRPRTPHADAIIDEYDLRSPHSLAQRPFTKHDRKRVADRDPTMYAVVPPSRKRALIIEPAIEPTTNLEMRRARSRHRSRGPGAPIDRSEPFESDAGGFAAEQRLRELRERLNKVDDAIAEIKAGSGVGYLDSRR